ncbi:ATP-binding cassette domain-containing protein [Microbacterium sp. H1-D42]|uniref:ATP-binding cassette domain-containing protein n=1 Tax=Microbacterium sp. H1-D42 TaxID=2925844 RepID=UPI001F53A5EA|nr:ATP-binding cassette domain-containing protein [Microbacterium sp. H1-D42]UNK71215.1 ATP-binding cassette domain-containing protein [Microbacterium sp. H1-D42]
MPEGQVLEFTEVTKRFNTVTAVSELTVRVEPGAVTGFLGPNGAGKTTSLRILLGQVKPTSGTATIGGVPYSELRQPLRTVGAVLEESAYRPRRSATRQLMIAAKANGIPVERVAEVLQLVGLQDDADTRMGSYSLGMRQRLAVANALLGDPGVLVLDEPANGLDPEGIRWMRLLMRRLADEGRTVLVSSHVLSEIEQVADNVVVLSRGRAVYSGSMDELADPAGGAVVVDADDRIALVAALTSAGLTFDLLRSGVTVRNSNAAQVGAIAAETGIALTTLQQRGPSLEEVFLDLIYGRRSDSPRLDVVANPVAHAGDARDASPAGDAALVAGGVPLAGAAAVVADGGVVAAAGVGYGTAPIDIVPAADDAEGTSDADGSDAADVTPDVDAVPDADADAAEDMATAVDADEAGADGAADAAADAETAAPWTPAAATVDTAAAETADWADADDSVDTAAPVDSAEAPDEAGGSDAGAETAGTDEAGDSDAGASEADAIIEAAPLEEAPALVDDAPASIDDLLAANELTDEPRHDDEAPAVGITFPVPSSPAAGPDAEDLPDEAATTEDLPSADVSEPSDRSDSDGNVDSDHRDDNPDSDDSVDGVDATDAWAPRAADAAASDVTEERDEQDDRPTILPLATDSVSIPAPSEVPTFTDLITGIPSDADDSITTTAAISLPAHPVPHDEDDDSTVDDAEDDPRLAAMRTSLSSAASRFFDGSAPDYPYGSPNAEESAPADDADTSAEGAESEPQQGDDEQHRG